MRLAEDGTLILRSGSMSVGQGLETTLTQLVADRFGVAIEQVRWEGGDTDLLPSGKGNGGSGALCIGGSAVTLAMDKVIEKARRIAAELLEAAVVDVEFTDGRFTIAGTDRSVSLARRRPRRARSGPYPARRGRRPGGIRRIHPDRRHLPQRHACLRGRNRSGNRRDRNRPLQRGGGTRACAEPDDRRRADPRRRGAGRGSGAGRDHHSTIRSSGQMLTASFMDYQMPRAAEYPDFAWRRARCRPRSIPLGAKGVGEAGTVGALGAAMNAINDALAPLGIRHFDMPATPARVWAAMRAARAKS